MQGSRTGPAILFNPIAVTAKYRKLPCPNFSYLLKLNPWKKEAIWQPVMTSRIYWPQGRIVAETMEIAQDVARKLVESYIEHGDPLPEALRKNRVDNATIEAKVPVSIAI